jgi:hypothetical protein
VFVPVERVRRPEAAVREIQIRPSVAVEISHRYRRAQSGNVRLDVGDLRVERRPVVDEVNAGRRGFVMQRKTGTGRIHRRTNRSAIQPDGEPDGCEKRNGDDGPAHVGMS